MVMIKLKTALGLIATVLVITTINAAEDLRTDFCTVALNAGKENEAIILRWVVLRRPLIYLARESPRPENRHLEVLDSQNEALLT